MSRKHHHRCLRERGRAKDVMGEAEGDSREKEGGGVVGGKGGWERGWRGGTEGRG